MWLRKQVCLLLCIQVWFPAMPSVYGRPPWSSESSLWTCLLSSLHQAVANHRTDVLSTLHACSRWWLWPQAIWDHSVIRTYWHLIQNHLIWRPLCFFLSCQSRGSCWPTSLSQLCFWLTGPWSNKLATSESSAMPSLLTLFPPSASKTTLHPIKPLSSTYCPVSW